MWLKMSCHCNRHRILFDFHKNIFYLWIWLLIFISPTLIVHSVEWNDEPSYVVSSSYSDPTDMHLGIPDVQAAVGQLFSFKIPDDAFTSDHGKIVMKSYKSGKVSNSLPEWLYFDEKSSLLQGIPQFKDIGSNKIIAETTLSDLDLSVQSAFNIKVVEPVNSKVVPSSGIDAGGLSKIVMCNPDELTTFLSIQIDVDLDQNIPQDSISLINKFSLLADVPVEVLRLISLNDEQSILSSANLINGSHGNAQVKNFANSAVLQMPVGCSGSTNEHHKPFVEQLETIARNGVLSSKINYNIIGWILSKSSTFMDNDSLQGVKSAIDVDPINYNDLDKYDEAMLESRIIPSMVSPTFAMPSATPRFEISEKKHHRIKRQGRHAKAQAIVHHNIRDDIFFGGTPLATPDIFVTIPTKMVVSTVYDERTIKELPSITASPSLVSPSDIKPTPTVVPTFTDTVPTTEPTKIPDVNKIKNFKPRIINRLKKFHTSAGKFFSYKVPANTFSDFEDGDTRKLKLYFQTKEMGSLPKDSWIQFDPENQVIFALPLDEDIGTYEFVLQACDSEHLCAKDSLIISVRQHRQWRAFNHKFSARLKFERLKYDLTVNWRKDFVFKLASFFGDENADAIILRGVDTRTNEIKWSNDTLPLYPCPLKIIQTMYKQISGKKKKPNHPSKKFREHLKCCFEVQRVGIEYSASCEDALPTTPFNPQVDKGKGKDKFNHTVTVKVNTKPRLVNDIDFINATVGQVLSFSIPSDTFYDNEDGTTGNLRVYFEKEGSGPIDKTSWVQFNQYDYIVYGLPFKEDIGNFNYQFMALDSEGLSVIDAIRITVAPRPKLFEIIEFNIRFDEDYQKFRDNATKQVLVVQKLAKLMGDPDTSNIVVLSINKGSVLFDWTNATISSQENPSNESIRYVLSRLFNNDETLSDELIDIMKPEFKVIGAKALPKGKYLGSLTPAMENENLPVRPKETEHITSNEEIYITTIIPAVIIAAMLIIAAIIACVLYRKKRKGKMTTQDNNTFISKGIPIIFNDELDENKSGQPTNSKGKSPALLRDERPPLPPPEYSKLYQNGSDVEGADSPLLERNEPPVPPHGRGYRGHNPDDSQYDPSAPSYEPPPPFSTNSNSRQTRPKPTPTYRNPPPYVPP